MNTASFDVTARIGATPICSLRQAVEILAEVYQLIDSASDFNAAAEQVAIDLIRAQPDHSVQVGRVAFDGVIACAFLRLSRKGIVESDAYLSNVWRLRVGYCVAA